MSSTAPSALVDADALVELTRRLVRIPSVHDPARGWNEEPAAELIAEQMRAFGWSPQFDLVEPGRPNVFAVVDGDGPGPTLMFEGHSDVVTEGDPSTWTVDPFGAELRDGRIWGRGAADMKGGVAAMLHAADALYREGFPGRIVVAALVDEEGMMLGAKDFVARGRAEGVDAVICCEPEGGEICHVAKGALRLRVDVHGVMAHGAMPFEGRNPHRALGPIIESLAELERRVQHRHRDEYLGLPWVTPTVVRGGEPVQMNVIPRDSSIWLDVRTVPGLDHAEVLAEVDGRARRAAAALGLEAVTTVIDDRPSVGVTPGHALVRALVEAREAVTGAPAVLGGVPGATDGTVLSSRGGVASVVHGPGGKWIAHQADEYVEVDDLITHAHVYVEAARRYLRSPAVTA